MIDIGPMAYAIWPIRRK